MLCRRRCSGCSWAPQAMVQTRVPPPTHTHARKEQAPTHLHQRQRRLDIHIEYFVQRRERRRQQRPRGGVDRGVGNEDVNVGPVRLCVCVCEWEEWARRACQRRRIARRAARRQEHSKRRSARARLDAGGDERAARGVVADVAGRARHLQPLRAQRRHRLIHIGLLPADAWAGGGKVVTAAVCHAAGRAPRALRPPRRARRPRGA